MVGMGTMDEDCTIQYEIEEIRDYLGIRDAMPPPSLCVPAKIVLISHRNQYETKKATVINFHLLQ